MEKYLNYIIPLVSVLLSYFLGRWQNFHTRKSEIRRERYWKFYVPFVRLLYTGRMDISRFSSMDDSIRQRYFVLIFENLPYIDSRTLKLALPFYEQFFSVNDPASATAEERKALDDAFDAIISSVLIETTKLSRSLHLPPIGKTFFREYRNRAEPQK